MTIWQTDDRQGGKWFRKRPKYHFFSDIFIGEYAKRRPRKGDRVIKRFVVEVYCPDPSYKQDFKIPDKVKVKPWH